AVPLAKLSISNITEPSQVLTVSSQIPNAFTYSGQTSDTVKYLLTPYQLNEYANTITAGGASVNSAAEPVNSIDLLYNGGYAKDAGNWITTTYPLIVTVTGYTSAGATSPTSSSFTFTSNDPATQALTTDFFNVTGIRLSKSLPGSITVNVLGTANDAIGNSILLAQLVNVAKPEITYTPSGQVYQSLTAGTNANAVVYNQQNGQPTTPFTIATNAVAAVGIGQYFTFAMNEIPIASATTQQAQLMFGLVNSTAGVGASPLFQLNYSAYGTTIGAHANMSYLGSTAYGDAVNAINAQQGFRTERGSKIASITPTAVTVNFAKAIDTLQLVASTANGTTPTTSYALYGPYSVGQATNLANVSIGKFGTPTITLSGTSTYSITGIGNITATPSISQATTPVLLKNLTTTPLVVLDSQANAGSNLILIGSGYVNTLSQQLQAAYNVSASPTMMVDQAYGTNRILVAGYTANQTTAAANAFIQQLYAATS
ncbi:MAG: S-layer protein, partial [Candidatus Micrarchaeaceae archaeon]